MKTALVIFQFTVIDEHRFSDYVQKAIPTVIAHSGKQIGSGRSTGLSENSRFERGAAFEFPNREAALAWYSGLNYQALLPLRAEAMDCFIYLIG